MTDLSATESLAAGIISRGKVEALRKRGLRVVVTCAECCHGYEDSHTYGMVFCDREYCWHETNYGCSGGKPKVDE